MSVRDGRKNIRRHHGSGRSTNTREVHRATPSVRRASSAGQGYEDRSSNVRVSGFGAATADESAHRRAQLDRSPARETDASSLITKRSFLSGPKTLPDNPLVVVSIPVWKTPRNLFERALKSILNQHHSNLVVLVSSDGEDTASFADSSLIDDPRVVTNRTERNWGPYFHHHVAWKSGAAPLFALQDSDDVSAPDRFTTQLSGLRAHRGDAAFPTVIEHRNGRRGLIKPKSSGVGADLRHPLDHFWLVRSDLIEAFGGYYVGTRMGADSLLTSLAVRFARCVATPSATYHRYARPNSLTQHQATGHQSSQRKQAKVKLQAMWTSARKVTTPDQLQRIISAGRSKEVEAAIELSVARVSPKLAEAAEAAARKVATPSVPAASRAVKAPLDQDLERVLDKAKFTDWSITRACAVKLYQEVQRLGSKSIVDFGSGVSTLVFALHAKRTGAKVVSLEADKKWLDITASTLRELGLEEQVRLIHAPLKEATRHKISRATYHFDFQVGAPYDFAFIDGPPERIGRHGTLPSIAAHMDDKWAVWLHDGARPGERKCVALWSKYLPLTFSASLSFAEDNRGVFKLTSR